jgi:hypothetical protein
LVLAVTGHVHDSLRVNLIGLVVVGAAIYVAVSWLVSVLVGAPWRRPTIVVHDSFAGRAAGLSVSFASWWVRLHAPARLVR